MLPFISVLLFPFVGVTICKLALLWPVGFINICTRPWTPQRYQTYSNCGRNFDFGLTMKSFVQSYQEQRLKWHRCTFCLFIWHSLNYRACSGRWLARSLTLGTIIKGNVLCNSWGNSLLAAFFWNLHPFCVTEEKRAWVVGVESGQHMF